MGTFIVGLVIFAWIGLSIRYIIKSKSSGCGGSCSGCDTKSTCSSTSLYEAYRKDHKKPVA